jgi:hypothetical protein
LAAQPTTGDDGSNPSLLSRGREQRSRCGGGGREEEGREYKQRTGGGRKGDVTAELACSTPAREEEGREYKQFESQELGLRF